MLGATLRMNIWNRVGYWKKIQSGYSPLFSCLLSFSVWLCFCHFTRSKTIKASMMQGVTESVRDRGENRTKGILIFIQHNITMYKADHVSQ